MSSGQRKRPGGAADSGPARKRSRLQPSSTGGTSQAEPIELIESGTPALEPEVIDLTGEEEVIDLTGESSEPEVITISDDESVVESEQNQQQPHLSMASENSAEPLERDEEEPRDTDDDWLLYDVDLPYWSDEDSEDRVQNQQQPHVSSAEENSAEPLERDDEEPRDTDDDWLLYDVDLPYWSDEDSEDRVQNQQQPHVSSAEENSDEPLERDDEEPRDTDDDWLLYDVDLPYWSDEDSEDRVQNQQQPHVSSAEENSAEPLERHDEEPRDTDDDWLLYDVDLPYWSDEDSEDRVQNQQQPHVSSAEENSAEPLERHDEEPRDTDDDWLLYDVDLPYWSDEDSELLEGHEEERSNVRVNSHDQVDGPGNGRGANEAPVAASAPAEQGAEEEDSQSSDSVPLTAQQGVVINCPICMDSYSEIMRHGRHLMSTMCGHVFCSRCLPVALETAHTCPTCREDLSPQRYHPIYL